MLSISGPQVDYISSIILSKQPLIVSANASRHEIIDTILFIFSKKVIGSETFIKQSHPDILIVGNDSNPCTMDSIRSIGEFVLKANISLKTQLVIVCDIEKVSANQANALLKLVEESSMADYMICFTTSIPISISRNIIPGVLPTLLSRSFLVFLSESKTIVNTGVITNHKKLKRQIAIEQYKAFVKPNNFIKLVTDFAMLVEECNA